MKLSFQLQQHTPIIHFQHQQQGATLRATELKPKLDLFLMEKMTGESGYKAKNAFAEQCENDASKRKYLVGAGKTQHLAFDYKVKIGKVRSDKVVLDGRTNRIPTFFADMGTKEESDKKALILANAPLRIEFFSLKKDLIQLIQKHFASFLSQTNFGTRQSKGFGSFYLSEADKHYQVPSAPYSFEVNVSGATWYEQQQQLFSYIDLFYRALRSGINIPGYAKYDRHAEKTDVLYPYNESRFYCKALLFSFLKSKGYQWDKKSIKEQFYTSEKYYERNLRGKERRMNTDKYRGQIRVMLEEGLEAQKEVYPEADILHYDQEVKEEVKGLYRDMFGLSTEQSWLSYADKHTRTHRKYKDGQWQNRDPRKVDNDQIVRFKSPLWFKPIQYTKDIFTVYFGFNPIPKEYRNQQFSITSRRRDTGAPLNLATPTAEVFNFQEFFDYIFDRDNINLAQHIDPKFHRYYDNRSKIKPYAVLKHIFDQLQR